VNNKRKESFTRSDIEESIKKEFPEIKSSKISHAIDVILESILDAVASDQKVEIRGFGTFSKKFIRPRRFTNPKTKKVSYLGETATIHFKPSKLQIKK
tara:strand:+ start:40 stop:333 length:294 start_codon:yes stop_codon:yes gene_type:complete